MDKQGKTLLIVWFSGVVFALVMAERWRRRGTSTPVALAPTADVPPVAPTPAAADGFRGRVVQPVAAGAKADLAWAKRTVGKVTSRGEHTNAPATS
jgi:hypothetical protein